MILNEQIKKLRAYHNDSAIKEKYVERVKAHAKADEIIQGYGYWKDGKGCAVGCTIEGSEHDRYETELGIPTAIAHVEDYFFELMPKEDARTFPLRFLESIKVGSDLSLVPAQLIVFILDDVLGVKEVKEDTKVTDSIKTVIGLWKRVIGGEAVESAAWSAAESAAWSAAWSATESATESAARSAAWSAARSAAWSAAESAAWSAAWSATESAAGKRYGDALIRLLEDAPVPEE